MIFMPVSRISDSLAVSRSGFSLMLEMLRRMGEKFFDLIAPLRGTSVKAYRLNKFLHGLIEPDRRQRFLLEEEVTFEQAQLTSQERDMVRRRDWRAMIQYGVIFFLLEKLGAVVGVSNLHIYAAMRGETLEEFQKTRNAQILYSVAGEDKQQLKSEEPSDETETSGRR